MQAKSYFWTAGLAQSRQIEPALPTAHYAVADRRSLCVGLAKPHAIGAPHLEHVHTDVPEALSRQFIAAVTLTSLLFWALLGSLTGIFYRRFSAA